MFEEISVEPRWPEEDGEDTDGVEESVDGEEPEGVEST
jgi:hypothetical protein